ncbi:hypothetical protein [Desertimonas flava]|uniref:hypothetical protein n=1 Tax=Desertimonas flava TaxID=2064846 RepID=UPI000E3500DF|nr:hypothetical protein [Desertimonas flava]
MAFGQSAGPPATARQLAELLELLNDAGHTDFRDARGPMGFNQRQAGGRFTRDEADEFIAQLQEAQDQRPSGDAAPISSPPVERLSADERAVRDMSSELLAAELQRRGWAVMEP